MYCQYYQANSLKHKTWFVFGCLRSEENLVFGRTLNKKTSLIEFFVPKESETHFLKIINYLKKQGYILNFQKLPNRLKKY